MADSPGLEIYGFGTFPEISVGTTLAYITVSINQYASTAAMSAPTFELWDGTSARIGATQTGTVSTSSAHVDTANIVGVTYSQLATLRVRFYAHGTTGNVQSIDYVTLDAVPQKTLTDAGTATDGMSDLDPGGKYAGGYYPIWEPMPRLLNVNQNYQHIILFEALPVGGADGSGALVWDSWDDTNSSYTNRVADIAACRARGQKIIMSIGGDTGDMNFTSRAKSQTCIDSIRTLATALGGIDGIDWDNFETVSPVTAEYVWMGQQLKSASYFGSSFIIQSAAGPWRASELSTFFNALFDGGALDYVMPMFYADPAFTQSYILTDATEGVGAWAAAIGGYGRLIFGFGIDDTLPADYMTSAEILSTWNAGIAAQPSIAGAICWNIYNDIHQTSGAVNSVASGTMAAVLAAGEMPVTLTDSGQAADTLIQPALAHDKATRWPTTTNTFDTTIGARTFTHTPVGIPAGVCVVVLNQAVSTAVISGVQYGGIAMSQKRAAADTTEAGRVEIWTLEGRPIPAGAQTVTITATTVNPKWASCFTFTSTAGQSRIATSNQAVSASATNPSVTLTTNAETIIYGGVHTGASNASSLVKIAALTEEGAGEYTATTTNSSKTSRYTVSTPAGSPAFGYTYGTADDYAIAAVAFIGVPPMADVGTGSDAISVITGAAAKPLAESGVGVDSRTIAVAIAVNDVGQGADTAVTAFTGYAMGYTAGYGLGGTPKALPDVGFATDALLISTAAPLADAGAATTSLAVTQSHTLSDVGTGTESSSLVGPLTPGYLMGYTAGYLQPGVPLNFVLPDQGSAAETLASAITTTLTDSAAGVDGTAVTANVLLGTAGTGTDVWNIALTTPIGDAGTATDSLAVTVGITYSSIGVATTNIAITRPLTLADSGIGTDTADLAIDLRSADAGAAADILTHDVAPSVNDTASATDSATVNIVAAPSDTAAAADTLLVAGSDVRYAFDLGVADDTLTVPTVSAASSDAGSVSDNITVSVGVSLAEVGAAATSLALTETRDLGDTGRCTDVAAITAAHILPTGSAIGTDRMAVATSVVLADAGICIDSLVAGISLSDAGTGVTTSGVAATALLTDFGVAVEDLFIGGTLAPLYMPHGIGAVKVLATGGTTVKTIVGGSHAVTVKNTGGSRAATIAGRTGRSLTLVKAPGWAAADPRANGQSNATVQDDTGMSQAVVE